MRRALPFTAAALFTCGALGSAALVACSLGLDESKLFDAGTLAPDDSSVAPDVTDAQANDARPPTDAAVDAGVKTSCSVDADCAQASGCQTSRCDVGRGVCVTDTCRAACKFTACNAAAQACGSTEVGSKSVLRSIALGNGITVSGNRVDKSIAAVHPFVFLTTNTGVAAYAASSFQGQTGADAQVPDAPRVPVSGVGFLPTHLVASGTHLYMLGDPLGPEGARAPLAVLNVGASGVATALAKPLVARSLLLTPQPAALRPEFAGPQNPDAIVLAQTIQGQAGAFAAVLADPIAETTPLTLRAMGTAAGFQAVASSKDRLVAFAAAPGAVAFRVVTQAGTAASQAANVALDAGVLKADGPHAFAQGPDGTVLWAHRVPQQGRDDLRVAWLKAGGAAGEALTVDHVQAVQDNQVQLTGAVWVDANTVALLVGLQAVPNLRLPSSKIVLMRRNVGVVREIQLGNVAIEQVGMASSAGFLYVLQTGGAAQLLVVAPDCP
jgi:hypothetical protein